MKLLFKVLFITFIINLSNAFCHDLVAFVDLDYILKNSTSGKKIVSNLSDINEKNIKKIKDRESNLKKKETELIKTKNVISENIFNQKLEKLKEEINKFKKDNNEIRQSFEKIKKNKLNNFLIKIEPLLNTYMKENSIDILLDKKNVFMGKIENDITKNLLKIVDENINDQ